MARGAVNVSSGQCVAPYILSSQLRLSRANHLDIQSISGVEPGMERGLIYTQATMFHILMRIEKIEVTSSASLGQLSSVKASIVVNWSVSDGLRVCLFLLSSQTVCVLTAYACREKFVSLLENLSSISSVSTSILSRSSWCGENFFFSNYRCRI